MVNQYALVTRDEVKAYRLAQGERLESTPDSNDLLDKLINAVSARIERYCNRKFKSRDYTEYYDGKGSNRLFPNHYPIVSVTSVSDDYAWAWDSYSEIDDTDYRVEDDQSIVFKVILNDSMQNIKLVYNAGFTTIPSDLKHVCISEVIRIFDNMKQIGISSKSENDQSLSYETDDFLPESKTVLNSYRRYVGL